MDRDQANVWAKKVFTANWTKHTKYTVAVPITLKLSVVQWLKFFQNCYGLLNLCKLFTQRQLIKWGRNFYKLIDFISPSSLISRMTTWLITWTFFYIFLAEKHALFSKQTFPLNRVKMAVWSVAGKIKLKHFEFKVYEKAFICHICITAQ